MIEAGYTSYIQVKLIGLIFYHSVGVNTIKISDWKTESSDECFRLFAF
jgi:hypothetical protein